MADRPTHLDIQVFHNTQVATGDPKNPTKLLRPREVAKDGKETDKILTHNVLFDDAMMIVRAKRGKCVIREKKAAAV